MTRQISRFGRLALAAQLVLFAIAFSTSSAVAQVPNMVVYNGQLQNGWQNWSWATVNFGNASPSYSGGDTISVTVGAWQALYLDSPAFNTSPYTSVDFWINGGAAGGQKLQVQAMLAGNSQPAYMLPALEANTWQHIDIPLSTLGVANAPNFNGFWIMDSTGGPQPTFYVADISILSGSAAPPATTISVDASANTHPISPLIYGVAFATTQQLEDLNSPLNRAGGNNESMYNWEDNASNHGSDWYFESIADPNATPGYREDSFFSSTKAAGAQAALTVPMIGWVANLGENRGSLDSFSVAKYGAQQATDPYWPDAGNGVLTNGQDVTGNNPSDANVPSSAAFETGWLNHMVGTWGTAANGGVSYYLTDNEPSLWQSTHRDVHPVGATMDEVYNDIVNYGTAIKTVDPTAQIMGPEEWGWTGYFYSGYDQQYGNEHGWGGTLPDRAAHDNMDYVPWVLQQLQSYQNTTGKRLLDVLSLHFYPQAGEYSSDDSVNTDLLRNRSTRQLWDPNYVSESWINAPVYLIPRMQQWVNTYYPGTKTAITEYNWGDEDAMNGATTQADILGIFGEYGLDMATRWGVPDPSGPCYQAMKMYRDYDGNKSTFGDTSVSDSTPDPDDLSSFAAIRSTDGALTIMVINKWLSGASTPVTIDLSGFSAQSTAQVWQLSSANPAITELPDVAVANNAITFTAAPQTVTLFVVPAASLVGGPAPNPAPSISSLSPASITAGSQGFTLTINGSGFSPDTTVTFGGEAVTPSSVKSTAIQAPISPAEIAAAGKYVLAVSTPSPGGGRATSTFTVNAGASVKGITLAPSTVTGGASNASATVVLASAAPAGGAIVQIASSNAPVAAVPASSITIPKGAKSASFTITTVSTVSTETATISATLGVTKTATLTVKAPALKTLTVAPTQVTGGNPVTGTVTLTAAAAVNTSVSITTGASAATIAAPVIVPAGQSSVSFSMGTSVVSRRTAVPITASAGGVTKHSSVTVLPMGTAGSAGSAGPEGSSGAAGSHR